MSWNAKQELAFAEGMLSRRQGMIESIGVEESKAEAWDAFQAMLTCVKEVRKHHGRVLSVVDDKTAGLALKSYDVMSEAELWLSRAEENVLKWGVSVAECNRARDNVLHIPTQDDIVDYLGKG